MKSSYLSADSATRRQKPTRLIITSSTLLLPNKHSRSFALSMKNAGMSTISETIKDTLKS
jgi:hypothetical protein